jgi:1-acylglycerone phosphate reductase
MELTASLSIIRLFSSARISLYSIRHLSLATPRNFDIMSPVKAPTVLITGCTDGSIGHGLVLSFARQGYHVFATARRLSAMASLQGMPNVTLIELDVTSPESIRTVHGAVSTATSGQLDILYNNAGIRFVAMGIDSTHGTATDTMAVNFCGVVEMVHAFSGMIISSKGKIVFTSSGAGQAPVPTQALYNASKAALDMYAKTLRIEMQPLGVGVINVITGQIATAANTAGMQPLDALDISMLSLSITSSGVDDLVLTLEQIPHISPLRRISVRFGRRISR